MHALAPLCALLAVLPGQSPASAHDVLPSESYRRPSLPIDSLATAGLAQNGSHCWLEHIQQDGRHFAAAAAAALKAHDIDRGHSAGDAEVAATPATRCQPIGRVHSPPTVPNGQVHGAQFLGESFWSCGLF